MDESRNSAMGLGILAGVVGVIVVLALLPLQLYRDWAFVCENTGSHRGHREWFTGHSSGHWYQASHLEEFMRKEHPSVLANRWTSYSGTGKNIFGRPLLHGHGWPGAVFELPRGWLDQYVDSLDDEAKLDLYYLLASDQQEEIKAEMEEVWEKILESARPSR